MSLSLEFNDLDNVVSRLRSTVQDAFQNGTAIDKVEEDLFQQLMQLGNVLLGSLFKAMKDGDVGPTLEKNGRTFRRLPEKTKRTYRSIFGNFELERFAYGTRQSQAQEAVPFDEHLGLPKYSYSLLIESWVGQLSTSESYHEACSKLERILKLNIPVDSAERIVSRLGKVAASVLESQPPIDFQTEAEILVQTSDNKGVVILDEQAKTEPLPVGAPSNTKGPKPNQKRMACMAGVYTIDKNPRTPEQVLDLLFHSKDAEPLVGKPPRPANPRYFARLTMVDGQGKQIGKSAEEQAQQWMTSNTIRRHEQGKTIVVMHDGQPSLWEQSVNYQEGWDTIDILDLLHVIPRIWDAGKILEPKSLEKFVRERIWLILTGGVGLVLMGLRRMTTTRDLTKEQREDMNKIINYLSNNKSRMDYGVYLSQGLPIATGFIEGACRHVIKDRLERSGMRWTREGAQSMLSLRCIEASDIWDPLMTEYRVEALSHHGKRNNYYAELAGTAA